MINRCWRLGIPLPAPGTVLVLADEDYCYCMGELTLRVERIMADPIDVPGLEWVRVIGHQILARGVGARAMSAFALRHSCVARAMGQAQACQEAIEPIAGPPSDRPRTLSGGSPWR